MYTALSDICYLSCLAFRRLLQLVGLVLETSRSTLPKIVILVFLFENSFCYADVQKKIQILYILSSSNTIYSDFQSTTSRYLHQINKDFELAERKMTASQLLHFVNKNQKFPHADMILSIGTMAGDTLSSFNDNTPILFTLITKNTYHKLVTRYHRNFPASRKTSAIFINLPIRKHLALIANALPEVKTVGIPLSMENGVEIDINNIQKKIFSLDLRILHISNRKDYYDKLPLFLKNVDVVLSLPDSRLHDKQAIRYLLISAFRQKKPIVGYSKGYVKAGALMAIFATTEGMGRQAAETVIGAFKALTFTLPEQMYPLYTTIEINYWVAQSLGIKIRPREEVLQRMKSMEGMY